MAVVVAPEKGMTITLWPTAFPKSFPGILEIIESPPMSRVVRSFGCFSGSNSFPVTVLLEAPLFFDFFLQPVTGVASSLVWLSLPLLPDLGLEGCRYC